MLAVMKARDFDDALRIANDTGVRPDRLGLLARPGEAGAGASASSSCGNLYLNRKCTGALVGVHPFGGFNMSGTDSKAGGRDYLYLFTAGRRRSRRSSKAVQAGRL